MDILSYDGERETEGGRKGEKEWEWECKHGKVLIFWETGWRLYGSSLYFVFSSFL